MITTLLALSLANGWLESSSKISRLPDTLDVSYSDGDFVPLFSGPWSFAIVTTTGQCTATTSGFTSGGNPDAYRRETISFATSPKSYTSKGVIFAVNTAATWTPNANFSRIVGDWDERRNVGSNGHQFLIVQGTHYYIGGVGPVGTYTVGTWMTGTPASALASNYNEIDTTTLAVNTSSHPNLTSGTTVTFGYAFYGEHTGPGVLAGQVDLDNWYVGVYVN